MKSPTDENNPAARFVCGSCGGEFTRDELHDGNAERIDAAVSEMKDEVIKDVKADFKNMFKKFGK